MDFRLGFFAKLLFVVAFCVALPVVAHSQDKGGAEAAEQSAVNTTADPSISPEELALLVKPMTADETKVEVDGWLDLVRAKAGELAQKQATVRRMNEQREEDDAELTDDQAPGPTEDQPGEGQTNEAKEAALQEVNVLRQEELELLDRLDVVLESLQSKGGDVEGIKK